MRYKIKAPSSAAFREVEEKLRAKNIQVFVVNEKRHTFSTGNIPSSVLSDIRERGVTVTPEHQYALEKS